MGCSIRPHDDGQPQEPLLEDRPDLRRDRDEVRLPPASHPSPRSLISLAQPFGGNSEREDPTRSRGFGFVTFSNEVDAEKAIHELNGADLGALQCSLGCCTFLKV